MSVLIVLFFLIGLAAVAVGTAMISLPAGIIAGGVGLIVMAIVLAKGYDSDQH